MRQICTHIVRLVSALIGILMLSSCLDDLNLVVSPKPQENIEVGFYAGGAQTRTTMLDNGLSAAWTAGDELAVWAKNSSGLYTLNNQRFETYGIDGKYGFFTTTLSNPMPDGQYTYYCSYPVPLSVDGTMATFNIPAVQDGKVTGGADIMIATPVEHRALTPVPDPEDHSGLSMNLHRMMHQFRFYVPQDDTKLNGEKIEKILLDFPKPVVGNLALDLSNPSISAELTGANASGSVTLNLTESISVSDEQNNDYDYACMVIVPTSFEAGQVMNLKAYSDDKIVYFDAIDLQARAFAAGHSTPVKLNVKNVADYAGILTFTVAANNLGENPNSIKFEAPSGCRFGDGASNTYVYNPGRQIKVGETIEFKFESDKASYMAFSGADITVTYDSDHAVVKETLTMPTISTTGRTRASLNVPYLLYEDFSVITKDSGSYGDNSYSSDERKQPGVSLDGVMPVTGWNASRYWIKKDGGSFRMNVRYQMVKIIISFTSSHYGRLDTPPLTGLKPGKEATLTVMFDAGANVNDGSNKDAKSGSYTHVSLATHENQSNPIDGVGIGTSQTGALTDFGTTYYTSSGMSNTFGAEDFGKQYPTHTVTGVVANSKTRLCLYPTTSFAKEGIGVNAEFNVYIDNIRVKIAN